MKIVISNRIYLKAEYGDDLDLELDGELTYQIDRQPISPYPEIIQNKTRVSPTVVSIPSGRLDLIERLVPEFTLVDKRVATDVAIPDPSFIPRPSQAECIDLLADAGNGLCEAPVGFGKTIVGFGLAHRLQKRTLIVTTTTTIRDMWIKEYKNFFGEEPGVVGGGKFDIDKPVVIGNIQTIRNRLDKLSKHFGIVIVDEVHRAPAKTFTDTLNQLHAKHKFGLSGTMVRKDGMHIVLPDYFGRTKFVGKVENVINPEVHLYSTPIELSANEFIPWAQKINTLMNDAKYRAQILQLFNLYMDAGHSVLLIADRTEFLEYMHLCTEDRSVLITGKITGAEKRQEIMDAVSRGDARGLAATQSIFSEGVSLNELSCVILATPINNEPLLVQIIGRIMRLADNKKCPPVVVDIGLSGNTGKRHRSSRQKTYVEKGWVIKSMGQI